MNFFKYILLLILMSLLGLSVAAQISIEQCVEKARNNYPLIKKYNLLKQYTKIDLSEINKSWLPKISFYSQINGQNIVPSYPEALTRVLEQMGQDVKGLSRIQYKIGVEVNQTIWDGGASSANREIIEGKEEMKRAALDVDLYTIRELIENLFFSILLIDDQITQSEATYELLKANLSQLQSMFRNGIAMQSDCDMVEAQMLTINQSIEKGNQTREGLRKLLELYIGEEIPETLMCPQDPGFPGNECQRPELLLFEKKEKVFLLTDKTIKGSMLPKIGFFAQAYYGYPGFDYFKSMMSRSLSFNVLAGIKASWNLDSFYSKKNKLRNTKINIEEIKTDRDLFLFHNALAANKQTYAIEGLKRVMQEDERIVRLRTSVRKAAESQLKNGVIDATALLAKITDENLAILNAQFHRIQYLQEQYKLKYILNK